MPIPSYTPNTGSRRFSGLVYPKVVTLTEAVAGVKTYTAAEILGGLILRDPNGAARSDVFPTAQALVAAIEGAEVGSSFEFDLRNTADAAETITMTAGTGITISGTATIAQNNTKHFMAVVTAIGDKDAKGATVTIYSHGTSTF